MSYDAARQALFGQIKTVWEASAFAAVPIEWENFDTIDLNSRADPFVTVELGWRDAQQAAINDRAEGDRPPKRQNGEILMHICVKPGTGSKSALQMIDVLDALSFQKVSGVQLLALRPFGAVSQKGWRVTPVSVSFWYDD